MYLKIDAIHHPGEYQRAEPSIRLAKLRRQEPLHPHEGC
jgi:hypothetical protein